jgi:hypothetical protein
VYRAGVPRKRRRLDTASSPACPLLAAASGQGLHVVPNQQATSPRATQAPEGSKRRRWARLAPEEGGTGASRWPHPGRRSIIMHNGQIVFPAGMEREGPFFVGIAATASEAAHGGTGTVKGGKWLFFWFLPLDIMYQ